MKWARAETCPARAYKSACQLDAPSIFSVDLWVESASVPPLTFFMSLPDSFFCEPDKSFTFTRLCLVPLVLLAMTFPPLGGWFIIRGVASQWFHERLTVKLLAVQVVVHALLFHQAEVRAQLDDRAFVQPH